MVGLGVLRLQTFACLLLLGCASGSSGATDSGPRVDTGFRRDSGPRVDGGGPGTDAGNDAGVTCEDDSYADDCSEATALAMLNGGEPMMVEGVLPTLSDVDWFAVEFPPESMGNMQGQGMPSLQLEGDSVTVMDIRERCDASLPVVCGEGSAREATSYSFVDDQAMPGEAGDGSDTYTTRDVQWPTVLYVRVGRRGGPATCDPYTLTISR